MWASKTLFGFEGRLLLMAYDIKNTLAVNLQHLMENSADMKRQNSLAKRSKVGQTTIGNYLRPDSYTGYPSLEKIEMLAKALGIDVWVLLHPTLGSNCLEEKEFELYRRIRSAFAQQ